MNDLSSSHTHRSQWIPLYWMGAIAILWMVLVFRRNCGVELVQFNGFGIFQAVPEAFPVSAIEWFLLLQDDAFVGLSLLGLIDLINYLLLGLVFLALFVVLQDTNKPAIIVASVLGWIGVTIFMATNQSLGMLRLSDLHAAATSERMQTIYLAAGEALLSWDSQGSPCPGLGYCLSLFLVLLAGLIISIVMLRSQSFSRATGIVGIIANGVNLLYFITLLIAPAIIWLPPSLSAPFRVLWYLMIAWQLIKLANVEARGSIEFKRS